MPTGDAAASVVPPVVLTTDRLLLRPFMDADLDDVRAMRRHEEVARFLPSGVPTEAELVAALSRKVARSAIEHEGDSLSLAVVERAGTTVVGDVTLTWTSAVHRQAELGGTFHPHHQGRGLAAEAGGALLALAFEGLAAERVVGRCHADNRASAALCERLGMRREAHFRHSLWLRGGWADELVYAVLSQEWRDRTAR